MLKLHESTQFNQSVPSPNTSAPLKQLTGIQVADVTVV